MPQRCGCVSHLKARGWVWCLHLCQVRFSHAIPSLLPDWMCALQALCFCQMVCVCVHMQFLHFCQMVCVFSPCRRWCVCVCVLCLCNSLLCARWGVCMQFPCLGCGMCMCACNSFMLGRCDAVCACNFIIFARCGVCEISSHWPSRMCVCESSFFTFAKCGV